jgi:glucans biosynthesis protein
MAAVSSNGALTASGGWVAQLVRLQAKKLAGSAYAASTGSPSEALAKIGYDEYRDIRFRPERAVWHGEGLGFELQFFASAYIYRTAVEIFLVEGDAIRPMQADHSLFDFGAQVPKLGPEARFGFSGFRIHTPLNRADYYDECIVFQGASYFRALGRGHNYGLSARALSINTGNDPEEFPLFKAYWIERPTDASAIRVHALLDSPSVAGAYSFVIAPGTMTVIDVEAVLFPRCDLANVGIAPLSSMFFKGTHDQSGTNDFRPAVHDSDGLAIWNGRDERLWRPLTNPAALQVSCFGDTDPHAFGLIQRDRSFAAYQDLEARYQDRPSVWIEPRNRWGSGCVQLVEIPTEVEYFDNIVAFWRPEVELRAGQAHELSYRLTWRDDAPAADLLRAVATRIGRGEKGGTTRFVIDFVGSQVGATSPLQTIASVGLTDETLQQLPVVELSANAGVTTVPLIQPNMFTGGLRVVFDFDPHENKQSELRLQLMRGRERASETWLFRWHND